MKKILTHKLVISMIVIGAVLAFLTAVGSYRYPAAFAIMWTVYSVMLVFAVVVVRRDIKAGR